MSKPITAFFKRKVVEVHTDTATEDGEPAAKKTSTTTTTTTLTDEQTLVIEEKKLEAAIKLADSKKTILTNTIGPSWRHALRREFEKDYFKKLQAFVEQEYKSKQIFPKPSEVFSWSRACSIDDVKVVVIGQDPYHGPNQAHGLCFSVNKGVATPPSLKNIYKELANDVDGFKAPNHGYLMSWAKQGVLLLNAVLTVQRANANSHKDKGWEDFTDAVIQWISQNKVNVVFMLWGNYAKKKGRRIDKSKHLVLEGAHPSPLSATRWFGCKHFSKANAYLKKKGLGEIDWNSVSSD